MSIKTTRKDIVCSCDNIVKVGYCELQYLLHFREPFAHTEGIYGWNFNCYNIHGITLCTGYRNMPGIRAKKATEFENKAMIIAKDDKLSYDEKRERTEELLHEFCKINGGY